MSFNGLRSRSRPLENRQLSTSPHEAKLIQMKERAESIVSRISNTNLFLANSVLSKNKPTSSKCTRNRPSSSKENISDNYFENPIKTHEINEGYKSVDNFLKNLGLEEYISVFNDNEITIENLPLLSKEDLIDLNIPIGPRNRILNALKNDTDCTQAKINSGRPPTPQRLQLKDEVDIFISQITKQNEGKNRPPSRMSYESTIDSTQSMNYESLASLVREMGEKQNMMLRAIEESQRSIAILAQRGQIRFGERKDHSRRSSGSSSNFC
ncbi:unnamed protein product [Blepharisma stoltei]|uniref:SAM domain-containing protein n=1 Tax=Blepharisma stoltei TaxID=1481888 RepID=A0AAU9I8V5_9CILI|nr:unnamed protein product [Blepharisma stoltei]